ncbi:MAG: ABC transporter ATP-binding protein [Lachnospiraceae bacterium]|nr:ABC transporter ATP-binding protein [Lachnospiraceae bacterium]
MLSVNNLTKKFGSDFTAVDNVSFTLESGKIAGFVGENGAGKTTTIKMMTGVLSPSSGSVLINGFDMAMDPIAAKKSIAYVPDNPDMFLKLRGIEFLSLMADIYGVGKEQRKARIDSLSVRFGIKDALGTRMSDYSHGMRQKLMIVSALIHEPPVWILDEPMTGLDPASAYELKQMMKEHAAAGNSVFFSTHVLEVAEELCDMILFIRKGKLVFSGSLEELKALYPTRTLEEIFLEMNGTKNA